MKRFIFTAKTKEGKNYKGRVEATSVRDAVSLLRKRGLVVVKLDEEKNGWGNVLSGLLGMVTSKDVTTFTRQLATMVEAGLSLTESLRLLQKQFSGKMSLVIEDILSGVEGGDSFSRALKKHDKIFGTTYRVSVRAGEEAGVLEKVLSRLADNLERKREFMGKIKSSLIYPAIVIVGMGIVMFVVMTFVVPKLTSMYAEFGTDLPIYTRILMSVSSFFSRFFWTFPVFIFIFMAVYRSLYAKEKYRMIIDRYKLKMPIVGGLLKILILTEVTRTLGMLTQTGVSLVESLDLIAQSTGNEVYRSAFDKAKKRVEKGFPFSEALEEEILIPTIVPQMVSTGEETGKLDDVLFKLSGYFETEADQKIKGLTSAIEPLIIIVLGAGVGFLVFAVVMPIYNLTAQF